MMLEGTQIDLDFLLNQVTAQTAYQQSSSKFADMDVRTCENV
jgi:hypothetical protein